jgi:hypothetical protein
MRIAAAQHISVYDDKLQFIAVTEGEQKQGTNTRDNS